MKKKYFSLIFFLVVISGLGCACTTKTKEEIKTIKLDLQRKEKTIANLLDRISMKDQEIGKLTEELRAAHVTIEDLRSDIEKLREIDIQMEEKKKEVDNRIEETIPTTGTDSATAEEKPE